MTTDETPPSILLVDDTVENLRVLAGMLAKRGFDARPVTSGQEALEAVAAEPPDLILCDVSMPGMDGFEVCARLKSSEAFREIPIIFLTAHTELSDKLKAFSVGGADYITKPFQFEEVVARVSQHIALRTARKQLERTVARLKETERLRDDLVHMLVHDMRSPLTALIMSLDVVRMQIGAEHRPLIDSALEGAERVNGMADTLLDISRLEAAKMPIQRAPCDLSALIAEARSAVSGLDPSRQIEHEASGPVLLTCDAGLVRRVVENLISNGIKHTPRGGRLRIGTEVLPDRVRLNVQDEGPGVPEHLQGRIFDKFGASNAHREGSFHSVGLGLAFCKLAIQAHGGSIGVDCTRPPGSRFWFEIPTGGERRDS